MEYTKKSHQYIQLALYKLKEMKQTMEFGQICAIHEVDHQATVCSISPRIDSLI